MTLRVRVRVRIRIRLWVRLRVRVRVRVRVRIRLRLRLRVRDRVRVRLGPFYGWRCCSWSLTVLFNYFWGECFLNFVCARGENSLASFM